jgi:nucleotide-binding universal stress UspA family protein
MVERESISEGETMSYRRIMVALACRDDESRVIDEAVRFANTLNVQLVVVHVNDPHAGEMSMLMDKISHRFTEEEIRELFRKLGHEEIAERIEVRILVDEVVHKAITRASQDVDLLILGHRKMSTFKQYFFDSVDEGIVNHVDCPVLVVPKE